jgi:hypothetical protein
MAKTKKLSEEMARELCGELDHVAKYISHIFFVHCPVSPWVESVLCISMFPMHLSKRFPRKHILEMWFL